MFESFDGKLFPNEKECRDYERRISEDIVFTFTIKECNEFSVRRILAMDER
jgi:hypothetical protein